MNILILPAFFQTKKRQTLGSFFLDQAKALQRNGHQVTILYCDTYSVKCVAEWLHYEEVAEQDIEGIKIYRMKCFCPMKHGMKGYKGAFSQGIEKLYDKYLAKQRIDIIHAHCCVWAGYAAMRLSEKTAIPYVITEHATLFYLHRNEIGIADNATIAEVFHKASKVICVSRAFGKLIEEYANDIEIIGNVVDCEKFRVKQSIDEQPKKEIRCLTVCYMEEEAQLYKKGIDILIKAWAKVSKQHPEARLIFGGGGKAKDIVVEWVKEYQLTNSVEFLGALDRKQVIEQMQLCDCFVLPSRYETFGVVYIEAMACGKPVIAVQNGGPDDFIKDFNGILIKPEQTGELISALKKMISAIGQHDSLYQAERIASYVNGKFSYRAIAEQLEEVYSRINKDWENN